MYLIIQVCVGLHKCHDANSHILRALLRHRLSIKISGHKISRQNHHLNHLVAGLRALRVAAHRCRSRGRRGQQHQLVSLFLLLTPPSFFCASNH